MLPFSLSLQTFSFSGNTIEIFVPDPLDVKELYEEKKISFPYWSRLWTSAFVLAEFLQHHINLIEGKSVIELGAGLGLPSFSIAKHTKEIVISDHNEWAVEVIKKSILQNHCNNATALKFDWTENDAIIKSDVVMMSDVNYHQQMLLPLLRIIEGLSGKGTCIILATPQRIVGRDLVNFLLQLHALRTTIYREGEPVDVFVLNPEGRTSHSGFKAID